MVQQQGSQKFISTLKVQKHPTLKSPRLVTNIHPKKELNISADKTLTKEQTISDDCNVEVIESDDHIKTIPSSTPALRMNTAQHHNKHSGRMHVLL